MSKINFGFWKKIKDGKKNDKNADGTKRPIFALAPMADVTDEAFRKIIAKYSDMGKPHGGPDVMWTEFVSADGLCSPGREVLIRDLAYDESERPIVAQIFTAHPEKMFEAAVLVEKLGFDGLDINMGCPDRGVEKQGAGASLIKNPALAKEIIEAARKGAPTLPISVKTRLGYNKVEMQEWIGFLLRLNLPVLTVHLRTRKEMSDVPAHWEIMPEILRLRDEIQSAAGIPPEERTIILGNGDVIDLADAQAKAAASGADGVMLGRAIFGNPWLFNTKINSTGGTNSDSNKIYKKISVPERLRVMAEHTLLFEKMLGDIKSFAIMKKHYKAYVGGWDGAKEFRMKLMEAQSAAEVADMVEEYIQSYPQRPSDRPLI